MDQEFINQLAEKLSKLGTKRPLGFHYTHPFGTVPPDSIQCNGAEYNRTLYADFFAYATEQGWVKPEAEWQSIASANGGYCSYYSTGDGSTTFRTPKFAPFMQIAIASGNIGTYHRAGLPNIKGDLPVGESSAVANLPLSGAFYQDGSDTNIGLRGDADNQLAHFDASRSNPIYGRSTTVQPESHEWMICVVVAGKATNIGSVDVGNVMSAVAQVQTQVGAIPTPQAYVTQTWRRGTSWYRVWSDGWIEQGGYSNSPYGEVVTITLNKPLNTPNYTILLGGVGGSESSVRVQPSNQTKTSFQTARYYTGNGQGSGYLYWEALGY